MAMAIDTHALPIAAFDARTVLPALRAAGLVVTLSTDVPSATGATLPGEYAAVRAAFGWDDAVLADLARAAVDASFAPAATRARLHAGVDAWLAAPAGVSPAAGGRRSRRPPGAAAPGRDGAGRRPGPR